MDIRWTEKINDSGKALLRLDEAIDESKNNQLSSTLKDGVIQRFEFCYEICWKLMKYFSKATSVTSFLSRVTVTINICSLINFTFYRLNSMILASSVMLPSQSVRPL